MDSVNSTTCIKSPLCTIINQEKFLYTRELLSGRIFLGYYHERRYVPELKDYRDVVCVSNDEIELQGDINKIRRKWLGTKDVEWVGITGPDFVGYPKAFCFWVKLKNLAFGHYWFQIKHVKSVEKEVFLQLKCIRKHHLPLIAVTPHIKEKQISEEKNEIAEASALFYTSSNELQWDFNPKKAILSLQASFTKTIHTIQPYVTWRNFLYFIKMIIAFMIVLIMGIISLIGHLGEFGLKLLREFTLLVNAFTPIVIQLIDFITKIIGGFYILVAGMFFRNAYHLNVKSYKNNTTYNIPYSKIIQRAPQAYPVDWRERNRILRQELLSNSVERN